MENHPTRETVPDRQESVKAVRIAICVIFSSVLVGCGGSESVVVPNANLNRYSSVGMIPLLEYEDWYSSGDRNLNQHIAFSLNQCLAGLFQKEGLQVLPDFSTVETIPIEEGLEIMACAFGWTFSGNQCSVSLTLFDANQQVFSSTGKARGGMTYEDIAVKAAKSAFREFRTNYSGFDPNLASEYAKKLADKMKDWEIVDVNEATLREYLDKNIDTLDPIEGVWMSDRPGWPHGKFGILRDLKSPTRDFISISLPKKSLISRVGCVIGHIQKAARVGSYIVIVYQYDKPTLVCDANMTDDNSLSYIIKSAITGKSVAFKNVKIYPNVAATAVEPPVASPKTTSQGTGFAISPDGYIVTAHHVVKDARTIKVYLSKDSFASASILHADPLNDLVVLKVENTTPVFLPVAPMRSVKTGDRVFTIGFPVSSVLGEEAKYTEGVVSSLSGIQDTASFLQITVPVHPGNSGGPLVNEKGEVVGVITSTAQILPFIEESGTLPQNINWAVKADYLRPLIELPKVKQTQLSREQLIAKAVSNNK